MRWSRCWSQAAAHALFCFFFSSRRRHTRLVSDWSSDVCSSDLAVKCGLRGLVCSPLEIARLRQIIPADVQLVTPGIRPPDAEKDDQKRTLSPKEAIHAGANWLVIGRPICAAEHPRAAAGKILASLQEP